MDPVVVRRDDRHSQLDGAADQRCEDGRNGVTYFPNCGQALHTRICEEYECRGKFTSTEVETSGNLQKVRNGSGDGVPG